jgi:hypothetical protein
MLSGLLVMVPRNIAMIARAARHRVARPSRTGKRPIQQHNRQQAHASGENLAAILGRTFHATFPPKQK